MTGQKSKRGNNEGSIYKRADGRWAASMSLGQGKRKHFFGKTRQEVAQKLTVALEAQQHSRTGYLQRSIARRLVASWPTGWRAYARHFGRVLFVDMRSMSGFMQFLS
jgi:hypothetical protein